MTPARAATHLRQTIQASLTVLCSTVRKEQGCKDLPRSIRRKREVAEKILYGIRAMLDEVELETLRQADLSAAQMKVVDGIFDEARGELEAGKEGSFKPKHR